MVDVSLIIQQLRARGHEVTHSAPLSENAGDYEFLVDGRLLVLSEVNALLESEQRRDQ